LIWAKEISDQAGSELVIDDGYLYFGSNPEHVYKITLDGSQIEPLRIPNGLSFGKPVIYNDYLVYGTYGGPAFLFVHNKHTLERYWNNADFIWHVIPQVDNGIIYCTDLDLVRAYELVTGNLIWEQQVFGKNLNTPVVENEYLYFATGSIHRQDGYLYCIDKNDGAIVYQDTLPYMEDRSQWGGSNSGITIWNDYIYVPSQNRYLYCFNKQDGALVWRFLADAPMETPPGVKNGVVYTGSLNRTCYAIDAMEGKLIWSYMTGGSIRRISPQFYKDYVCFVSLGAAHIFHRGSGDLLVEMRPTYGQYGFWSAKWAQDGMLYGTGWEEEAQKPMVFAYQIMLGE
jgi:outer membrane protein assembly factor BamB